jgi:hypothetical protein
VGLLERGLLEVGEEVGADVGEVESAARGSAGRLREVGAHGIPGEVLGDTLPDE